MHDKHVLQKIETNSSLAKNLVTKLDSNTFRVKRPMTSILIQSAKKEVTSVKVIDMQSKDFLEKIQSTLPRTINSFKKR